MGLVHSRFGIFLHRQLDSLYNRALFLGTDLLRSLKGNK